MNRWQTTLTCLAVGATLTCASFAANAALANGLAGYWAFDDDFTDGSSNGNHGSGEGGVGFGPGAIGSAVSLNGVTQAVNVGNDASLDPGGPFTVAFFARIDQASLGGGNDLISSNQYFVSKGTGTFNSPDNTFTFAIANVNPGPEFVTFQVFEGGTAHRTAFDASLALNQLDSAQFYHFAGRWDGAELDIFLDGALVAGASNVPFAGAMNSLPLADMQIGRLGDGSRRFDGRIDDFGLWTRALSDAEIAAIATGGIVIPLPASWGLLLAAIAVLTARRRA